MIKTTLKLLCFSISILFLVRCDNHEFPKSPYPRIETLPVVKISETGVTFEAIITQHGKLPIINHGFVWSTEENLTIDSGNKIELGAVADLGNFEASVESGLYEGKTYFAKAFVATTDYLVYGETVSFVLP